MKLRNNVWKAGVVAALITVSACSSSSSTGSVNGSAAGTGRSSAASGSPIEIGFLNQGDGATAFPDFGAGGTTAAKYINSSGGVNGHPIDLITCNTDGTPTSSVKCANQFVGDGVAAVVQGVDFSSDSALPILAGAGIPLIGHLQLGVKQSNSPDAFFFGAPPGAYYAVPLVALHQKFGIKTLAILQPDAPSSRALQAANLLPVAKKLGISVKSVFYPAISPNYTAAFASAVAGKPDAVVIVASEPDCTGLVAAAQQLAYQGRVFAGSCTTFITANPSAAEGVFTDADNYISSDTSDIPSTAKQQIATYLSAMKGEPEQYLDAYSQTSFSAMMDLASALRTIHGPITPAAVKKAAQSVHDVTGFMGQALNCNGKQWPNEIAVCAPGLLVYQVQDGRQKLVSNEFISAASYFSK